MLQSASLAYATKTAAGEACAEPKTFRAGLQGADTLARLGDEYRRLGEPALARAQYQRALGIDVEQPIALAGSDALDQPATPAPTSSPSPLPDPMAIARALYAAGYDTEARAQVQKAIEADPFASIPPDLDRLGSWPAGAARSTARDLWELALWSVVLVILGLVITWLWRLRRPRGVDVAAFDTKAIDEKLGASLPKLIVGELSRMNEEGAGRSLGFVSGPDPKVELPADLVAEVPHGKVVAAILGLIPLRRAPYRVEGVVQARGDRGYGITISIIDPAGAIKSQTIWESEVDPLMPVTLDDKAQPAVVHRLALAATAWLLYSLPGHTQLYLTDDWRSYMRFRLGAAWHEDGDDARARLMYDDALRSDPSNRGALFNIGVFETQPEADDVDDRLASYGRAIARFGLAAQHLEIAHNDAGTSVYLDRLWYRIVYNSVAAADHRWLDLADTERTSDDRASDLRNLVEPRDALRVALAMTKAVTDRYPENDANYGDLVRFLGQVQLAGAILLADVVSHGVSLRTVQAVSVPSIDPEILSLQERLGAARTAFERRSRP